MLTERDVQISLTIEIDDTPVRGNALASGDDAADKACEDSILERLEAGDEWAWGIATVTACWNNLEASDNLGACSYESESDFRQPGGYYDDMVKTVLDDLNKQARTLQAAIDKQFGAPDPEPPTQDQAIGALRREYYTDTRELAESLAKECQSGEIADTDALTDRLHEEVDGWGWVIFTFKAQMVLLISDNDSAGIDSLGSDGFDWSDGIPWSQLAYFACEQDLWEAMGNVDNFDPHDDDEWRTESPPLVGQDEWKIVSPKQPGS